MSATPNTPVSTKPAESTYPAALGETVRDAMVAAAQLFGIRTDGDDLTLARRLHFMSMENRDLINMQKAVNAKLKERATLAPSVPLGGGEVRWHPLEQAPTDDGLPKLLLVETPSPIDSTVRYSVQLCWYKHVYDTMAGVPLGRRWGLIDSHAVAYFPYPPAAHPFQAQDAAPVAFVPIHPRNGPLWANTVPTMETDRPKSYPVMALYAAPVPAGVQGDAARLDFIAQEYLTVESFPMPTPGGEDADVGWKLSQYHQGEDAPREVHSEYRDDLRAAIDNARTALASQAGKDGE